MLQGGAKKDGVGRYIELVDGGIQQQTKLRGATTMRMIGDIFVGYGYIVGGFVGLKDRDKFAGASLRFNIAMDNS